MSQVSDPNADVERVALKSLDVAENKGRFAKKSSSALNSPRSGIASSRRPRSGFEFSTDTRVARAVAAIQQMPALQPPTIVATGKVAVGKGGVSTQPMTVAEEKAVYHGLLPDILAYLQNESELTRATIVRILKESGRLRDFLVNRSDLWTKWRSG